MLGLSTMTSPWDKLDGDRFRSAQLPSTYATWREYRRLNRVLRRRGRVLQSAPNIVTKVNALLFMLESAGGFFRETLKTTLLTLADPKSTPGLHRVLGVVTRFVNDRLKGDVRWQTLPVPFEVYSDGIDLVVFEEFGAGQAALHLADEVERNALMKDEAYRRSFRRDYERKWTSRVWQRDFFDAHIVACPDASVVGRSFGAVGTARGIHPVDAFLDLVVEHGKQLRWHTVIANHRPAEVERMMRDPAAIIGFADSGAHIRNMAFYNYPLRMLKVVRDAERAGRSVMPIEKAIWRLTGEIGDWLDIDAGHLRPGDRADVVVIDPAALDERLEAYHEAPMEGFGGLMRMVNRSDGTVDAVLVSGGRSPFGAARSTRRSERTPASGNSFLRAQGPRRAPPRWAHERRRPDGGCEADRVAAAPHARGATRRNETQAARSGDRRAHRGGLRGRERSKRLRAHGALPGALFRRLPHARGADGRRG